MKPKLAALLAIALLSGCIQLVSLDKEPERELGAWVEIEILSGPGKSYVWDLAGALAQWDLQFVAPFTPADRHDGWIALHDSATIDGFDGTFIHLTAHKSPVVIQASATEVDPIARAEGSPPNLHRVTSFEQLARHAQVGNTLHFESPVAGTEVRVQTPTESVTIAAGSVIEFGAPGPYRWTQSGPHSFDYGFEIPTPFELTMSSKEFTNSTWDVEFHLNGSEPKQFQLLWRAPENATLTGPELIALQPGQPSIVTANLELGSEGMFTLLATSKDSSKRTFSLLYQA